MSVLVNSDGSTTLLTPRADQAEMDKHHALEVSDMPTPMQRERWRNEEELRALLKKHLDALESDLANVRSLTRNETGPMYNRVRERYMDCLRDLEEAFLLSAPKSEDSNQEPLP